jgi:hypothetical protein
MELERAALALANLKAEAPCPRKKAVHFFPGTTGI